MEKYTQCDNEYFLSTTNQQLCVTEPPTINDNVTNKKYVDDLVNKMKWGIGITKFHNPKVSLPRLPKIGDKYVSSGIGNTWKINNIYEYTGNDKWIETYAQIGYIVYDNDKSYIFNGMSWEEFGMTVDHDKLKNIGNYSHKKIDSHIDDKKVHLRENMISHKLINDIGTFSHNDIDEHIRNSSNAHFGQNLRKNGSPMFNSIRVSDVSMASHVVTKEYVDNKLLGLNWEKPVIAFVDSNVMSNFENNNCNVGDRYISIDTNSKWKKNHIYEFMDSEWKEIIPIKNMTVYVESGNIYEKDQITFNGLEWIKFGSTSDHSTLSGIGKYTHKELDSHVDDVMAHFAQDLRSSGSPIFKNIQINGTLDTHECNTSEQLIKKSLQIGNYKMPYNLDKDNLTIVGNNDKLNLTFIYSDHTSNDPINLFHMRSRGDVYNPIELLKDTPIGSLTYMGFDGEKYCVTSTIQCVTTEDYTPQNHGSALLFSTTTNETGTPKINLMIHDNGQIQCFGTQDSLTPQDGTLVVNGGIGIEKNISVGGTVFLKNMISFKEDTKIVTDTTENFDNKIINICGCGENNNKRGGIVTISGKDSILDGKIQLNAGVPNGTIELLTGNKIRLQIEKAGRCTFTCDEQVSSHGGSVIVNGGINIKKNLFVGGNKIIYDNELTINSTSSLANDTSSLTLCGGGTSDYERGGIIKLLGSNNKLENAGGINMHSNNKINLYVKNKKCCSFGDTIEVISTTDANSNSTGAIIIEGGVGIKKKLYCSEINCDKFHCNNLMNLPTLSAEPETNEIGIMYYDTVRNHVRIRTNSGWRNLVLK